MDTRRAKNGFLALAVAIVAATAALPAAAVPSLAIDTDPSTLGIQSNFDALLSDSIQVDVVISDVDPLAPLNAFEFDLTFLPSVLTATTVVSGGFLLSPTFTIQQSLGVMRVEFAEVSLLPLGGTGSGILATINFDVVGEGTSALSLENVILSAPFGVPIPVGGIANGSIQVGTDIAPIPEPTGALLFAIGLFVSKRVASSRAAE